MMIKNLAIGGAVGLLFMSGGFFVGLRLVHVPKPKKAVAVAVAHVPATVAERETLSLDGLRKTSQGMIDVSQALQARELAVAAREKKAQQLEDELDAERAALDRAHAKFHELYGEFQQRLQLVNANESDQLQRQMTIYTSMDPASAADLLRALDDGTIVRLFSIMETKPLSRLVEAWKTKYPGDSTRLLTALTQMGQVMPQDKIALAAPADANANAASASNAAPDASSTAANAPANSAADSGSGDGASTGSPVVDSTPTSATAPDNNSSAPTPAPADSDTTANPADSASSQSSTPPAPDASGSNPASDSAAAVAAPAASPPPASAIPAAPASPALSPPPDTSAGHSTTSTTPGAATGSPDSPSLLGVPGETAAQAAEIAQRRTGRLSADISTDRAY